MKRRNSSRNRIPRLILALGILLSLSQWAQAQLGQWTRYGLDGGGVAHDVQLLRHDDVSPVNNELWSVSMSTGYYRATWSSGAWSDWTAYQPGKSGLGVDAIEVGGVEYVIVGTSSTGVQYCNNPTAGSPDWHWPVENEYDPEWEWARIHDAAFFWPSTGNPTGPEAQYYFILAGDVYDGQQTLLARPGLYRWNSTTFARIDGSGWMDTQHDYTKFYRDIAFPDILYLDRRQVEGGEYGGLYKLSCSSTYGNQSFTEVNLGIADLRDVLGFNQCLYDGDVYSYVLVKRVVSGNDVYSVYVGENIADEEPEFDLLDDYTDIFPLSGSTRDLYDVRSEMAGVMGKPHFEDPGLYHYLWIVSVGAYGVWFDDTDTGDQLAPINGGSTSVNGLPDLLNWGPRCFTPDDPSHFSNYTMAIFMATHHGGVWRLRHTPGNAPVWNNMTSGYTSTEIRDIRIIPGTNPIFVSARMAAKRFLADTNKLDTHALSDPVPSSLCPFAPLIL